MAALNDASFRPPLRDDFLQRARGFDTRAPGKPSNGGMSSLQEVNLEEAAYWRFCDKTRWAMNRASARSGPWWIDHETMIRIHDHANNFDYSSRPGIKGLGALGYVASLHLAVPLDWGDCYILTKVRRRGQLRAWVGAGKAAEVFNDKGKRTDRYIPVRDRYGQIAKQYYVPSLENCFDKAFEVVREMPAAQFLRGGL